ncbi:MAG: hypothetical protein JJU00_09115 [Opitutales bacterium]|nr:hypothetical protein [Opitutales bacterium]
MNTKLLALALAVATAAVPLTARPVVEADLTFSSKNVFRGLKLSDAAVQPAVTANFEAIYIGLWASVPIRDSDELSELDAFAGWRQPLTENFTIDIGATMYRYWNTSPADVSNALGGTRYSQEVHIGGDLRLHDDGTNTVGTRGTLYYDVRRRAITAEASLGYARSFAENGIPLSLSLSAYAGYVDARDLFPDSGATVRKGYHYTGFSADLPYEIGEDSVWKLGVAYGDVGSYFPGTSHLQKNFWVRGSFHFRF